MILSLFEPKPLQIAAVRFRYQTEQCENDYIIYFQYT